MNQELRDKIIQVHYDNANGRTTPLTTAQVDSLYQLVVESQIEERNNQIDEIFEHVGDGNVMEYDLTKIYEKSKSRVAELQSKLSSIGESK